MSSYDLQKKYEHIQQTIQIKSGNDIDISNEILDGFSLFAGEMSDEEWNNLLEQRSDRHNLQVQILPDLSPFPLRAIEQILPVLKDVYSIIKHSWETNQQLDVHAMEKMDIIKEQCHAQVVNLLMSSEMSVEAADFVDIVIPENIVETHNTQIIMPYWIDAMQENIILLEKAIQNSDKEAMAFYCMQIWHNNFGLLLA